MFYKQQAREPHEECVSEINLLDEMVRWAYRKLQNNEYISIEDAVMLHRMKMWLKHGIQV